MTTARPDEARPDAQRVEITRLRRLALRDEVTGVANRRAFLQRLREELSRSRRYGLPFSLVLFDFDGLKDLNDTFGHQAGDRALKQFSRALLRAVRTEDLVARIGGDEFAVIAVHGSAEEAPAFAERIREVAGGIVRRVAPRTQPVLLSAAAGVATWTPDVQDAETLFARAETDLLAEKHAPARGSAETEGIYRPRGRRAVGEELRRLLAMARHVSSARELEDLVRAAAEQAAALVSARMAAIALRQPDGRTRYGARFVDGAWQPVNEPGYRDGQGITGRVMELAEPYVANDVRADPYVDPAAVERTGMRNIMSLPLRDHAGTALGVLSLMNKRDDRGFTEADVSLAMAFADLVAVAIQNVRTREQTEEAFATTRSLIEQAHDAIYITDPQTRRVLDANVAAEHLSGYSREELLTMRAPDLRPPEDREAPGTTDMALHGDGALTLPRRHQRKDGTIIPVEVSARLVQTPQGKRIVNIVRDVSERVAAEEELRRRNRELQARNDVASLLTSADDDSAALTRMLAIVTETLGVEGGVLAQLDDRTGAMRVTAEVNLPEPLCARLLATASRPGEGLMGAALTGETLIIADTFTDGRLRHSDVNTAGIRSFAIVPVTAPGRVIGALAAGSATPERFGEPEVGLLRAVADQTALWLEHRRLLSDTRQREQDARFLADLAEALSRARDLDAVLRRLVQKTSRAFGCAVGVTLPDPDGGQWRLAAFYHPRAARRKELDAAVAAMPARMHAALAAEFRQASEPLLLTRDQIVPAHQARVNGMGIETTLLAPLRQGERTLGVLGAGTAPGEPRLSERHRALAVEISRHAAVAIANAIARRDLLARNRELHLIKDVTALAQQATDAGALHDAVVRRVQRTFRSDGTLLQLWDPRDGVLHLAAASGVADDAAEWLGKHPPRLGERMSGTAAARREAIMTEDVKADPNVPISPEAAAVFRARSGIVTPLLAGDELIGTLSVISTQPGTFKAADLQLLKAVGRQLATALARFAAYERAERSSRYTRAVIDNTPDALFMVDPAACAILDVNAAAEALTGYSRQDLLAMRAQDLLPPTFDELIECYRSMLRADRHIERGTGFVRHKDGAHVPVEIHASVVASPTGRVILGIVRSME